MITRSKKIIFSLATLLVVVLILIAVEFMLRIFVPSLDNPLVTEIRSGSTVSYEVNRRFLAQYFPSDAPIIPELKPTTFAQHKPPTAFRIICLGSSSMFGTPYQFTANIPSLLHKQLQHLYPGSEIEVINFGAAAINSNVILDLSTKLAAFEPDLVLIYMGHNEFYGPEGVGATWIEKHCPSAISLKYALHDVRLVTGIGRVIASLSGTDRPAERNLMKQVSHGSMVRLHSEESERIFSRFETNLRRIVTCFRDRNVPVILSDLTSNLMFPPFMYDTSAALRPYASDLAAIADAARGHRDARGLEQALRLYAHDSSNAAVNYWIGSFYNAMHQPAKARPFLERARDEDLLKFRAPGRINEIIRTIAREQSLPLISADSLFAAITPGAVPGSELFREHLHPNARGYYEIATLFADAIVKTNVLHQPPTAVNPIRPFNPDSLDIPWLDLAYGDLAIRQLTTHWPFEGFHATMELAGPQDSVLERLAEQVYTYRLSLNDGMLQCASRQIELHRYRDALTSYASLIDLYPGNFYPYYLSASVYKELGDVDRAMQYYKIAMQYNPAYVYAPIDLGLLEVTAGRFDDAIAHFTLALTLTRGQHPSPLVGATIYYGLAAAYVSKGDIARALNNVTQALRMAPNYAAAQSLYNQLQQRR